MKQTPEYLQQRIDTCRKLFFEYKGQEHSRIEREMRAGGFPDFNRRCLYARGINSGWIEHYGWDRELQRMQPPACVSSPHVSKGAASDRKTRGKKGTSAPLNAFHAWIKKVSPPMFDWDAPHLKLLIKTLQLVTEGKIKRLMIFMPPRHGKSELVTMRYTAWRLLMEPALKVILASYNQHLANRFSRGIRNTLAEHFSIVNRVDRVPELQSQKSVSTGSGSDRGSSSPPNSGTSQLCNSVTMLSNPCRSGIINSAAEWETGKGGGVKAVGVGGGITGYGAQLMMIDDPIKSREQAESASYRDKVWHWFNDDMLTRLEPDASVILIQTRWHEDDLAGRLLKQQQEEGGEEWHVINLPAICEDRVSSPTVREGALTETSTPELTPLDKFHNKLKTADNPTGLPMGAIPKFRQRNYGDILREREEAKEAAQRRDAETQSGRQAGIASGIYVAPGEAERNPGCEHPKNPSHRTSDKASSMALPRSSDILPVETGPSLFSVHYPLLTVPDPLGREPGQALWPQRFDIKWLERTRRRMGRYSFEALYQQKPVPTEGGMFKRSWFQIVQVAPPNLNWKRGYDLSFAANPDCDPSATLKVAYDKDGVMYIDGCFTGKLNYPLQRKMLLHYIRTETRTEHGIELSANGHALLQDLRRMPQLFGKKFRVVKVETDKLTRALPWIALAEEGRVRLVAGRWNEDFITEACSFPHGHHDDQIDAVSIAVAMHKVKEKTLWLF